MAQDITRCPKWLPRCSRMPQDRSKTAPSGQRAPPRGPEEAKTSGTSKCLIFSPFRFRWPSEAP
eukprot:1927788-Pyramimonas_sp.AAC.1